MAHRVLLKLDALKRYEKKTLKKYDMPEFGNYGKIQCDLYQKTPVTFDFKLDYESSRDAKSNISAVPSIDHVLRHSSFQQQKMLLSRSSSQMNRKNYFGKHAVRPLSAPSYLEHKPIGQRGNLQSLDRGFMILKLSPKLIPPHLKTMDVQKRKVPEQYCTNYVPAGTSSQDGVTTVTTEKGNKTDQPIIYNKERSQAAQDFKRESKIQFCIPSDDLNARKDTLAKDYIKNKEGGTEKSFIHSDVMGMKKKAYIPLCIEDEIENPGAKVIRAGCPGETRSPVKMSESFPVLHHNEEYMEKYILNRWLALYGNKAFYDMNKRGEISMNVNPVLQNNYDETIAIISSRESHPSNITAKRKKRSTLSRKPKRIAIQILSVEKAPGYLPECYQRKAQFLQKIHSRVTRTVSRHSVEGRNIKQEIPKSNKTFLMVQGVTPQSKKYPSDSSSGLISKVKSQLPMYGWKQFTSREEFCKKGRMIFVDYIPISKSISVQKSRELFGQAPSTSIIHDFIKLGPIEINQSKIYHQDALEKESLPEEDSKGDIDFTAHEHLHSEDEDTAPSHSQVISIPTAQLEISAYHRYQKVKELNDAEGGSNSN